MQMEAGIWLATLSDFLSGHFGGGFGLLPAAAAFFFLPRLEMQIFFKMHFIKLCLPGDPHTNSKEILRKIESISCDYDD